MTSLFSCLLLTLLCGSRGFAEDESDEEIKEQLPRVPAKSPEEALQSFRLREDFSLELVAAEPDVIDPIAMDFDARGRLFVVEMRDYPFTSDAKNLTTSTQAKDQPSGRVRLLEDLDGDGKVDRSRVFLDGLHWPTAIACSNGGVFITAAPDVLFAKDTDDDGRADETQVIYTGFRRRNVQALVNGLKLGPDLYFYLSSGSNGGKLHSPARPADAPIEIHRRDVRFRPFGPLEALGSSGAQFGLTIDDANRRYVCSNSQHLRQVVGCDDAPILNPNAPRGDFAKTIASDGGAAPVFRASRAEPWRIVRTRWRANAKDSSRYASTELVPIGFFTSATGILSYDGNTYGEDYKGSIFVGDVGANLVHRKVLDKSAVEFRANRVGPREKDEFLVSSDNWFRPSQLVEGPDGHIYILDMYRETIEHPYSIPDRIKRHLSLTSGNDRGRIYRLVRKGSKSGSTKIDLSKADTAALVDHIASPLRWVRRTAARLLLERQAKSEASGLRRLAKTGEEPQSRLQALWTLSALDVLETADLEHAFDDESADLVESALKIALRKATENRSRLAIPLLAHHSARVRYHAALLVRTSKNDHVTAVLGERLRQESDPRVVEACLGVRPEQSVALALQLLASLREQFRATRIDRTPQKVEIALRLATAAADPQQLGKLLRSVASSQTTDRIRAAALTGIGQALEAKSNSLGQLLAKPPAELTDSVDALLGSFNKVFQEFEEDAAVEEQIRAIRLLAFDPRPAARLLISLQLDARKPLALQLAAIQSLAYGKDVARAEHIVNAWKQLSPRLRGEALEALFRDTKRVAVLLGALEAQDGRVSAVDIAPGRRKQLLSHPDKTIRARATKLLGTPAAQDRQKIVAEYQSVLNLEADPASGRAVYLKTCATCHIAQKNGKAVGPDLESVAQRAPDNLLLHILDPNREVAPEYVNYTAVLRDGRVLSGILAAETSDSITLRRAEAAEDRVLRSKILKLTSSGQSLMPEEVEKTVTRQELANLLAWIGQLTRTAPK